MKSIRTVSVITAAAIMLSPMSAFAAEKQSTVFPQFNKNEVNGTIIIQIPEGTTADISITFDSPEGLDFPYYSGTYAGGKDYSFDIEGRDNCADDYRYYNLSVTLTDSESNTASVPFTDVINGTSDGSFKILDPNDHAGSFAEYTYTFTADNLETGNSWDISSTEKSRAITVHLNNTEKGDVSGDGKIDAIDASLILTYYAETSAGASFTFSEFLKKNS